MGRIKKRKYTKKTNKKSLADYFRLPSLPRLDLDPGTKRGIFVVFILAIGAVSLLGLFDLAGAMGEYLKLGLAFLFGWGRWIIPFIFLAIGYFLYDEEKFYIRLSNYLGLLIFVLSFHAFLFLIVSHDQWPAAIEQGVGGGYVGLLLAENFVKLMGLIASFIATICLLIISFLLMFDASLLSIFGRTGILAKLFYPIKFAIYKIFEKNRQIEDDFEEDIMEEENLMEIDEEAENIMGIEEMEEPAFFKNDIAETKDENIKKEEKLSLEKKIDEYSPIMVSKKDKASEDNWWEPTGIEIDLPLDLLNGKKTKPNSGDIENNIKIIKSTLQNFGINVEMDEVSVGPTVTQYTFKPAEGVKLSKITTLGNDLALALAAHPIRIEAPIPGKSLVGIEVPNKTKAMVGLREVLSCPAFNERSSNLMASLGNDVAGKSWIYDIAKMPHLLVAGATNSGKSVCLNTIILSLFYQNNPDDVRLIMVDPKRVELTMYNDIPYLLTPVITDVTKTINALKWCLNEMDRRLNLLAKYKKKNIQTYNAAAEAAGSRGPGKIPFIIFIIDELADLMVVNAKEIEQSVIRLTQMARAVGIHLILATQRPSVDVITGLIKANMPSRIAFAVASGTDSRTILDSLGAEKLLGQGDMLFSTAESSKPTRIQGAFVSEVEIKKIVNYIKKKGQVEYIGNITERQKVQGNAGVGLDGTSGDEDDLLEEAKEVVINQGKASTTLLQRRLRIGYARAASIIDALEEYGVIGPANGSKPREILISKEQYANLSDQGISGASLHDRESSKAPESFLDNDEDATPPVFKSLNKGNENVEEAEKEEEIENIVNDTDDENDEEDGDEVGIEDEEMKIDKTEQIEEDKNNSDKKESPGDDDEEDGLFYSR